MPVIKSADVEDRVEDEGPVILPMFPSVCGQAREFHKGAVVLETGKGSIGRMEFGWPPVFQNRCKRRRPGSSPWWVWFC